MTTIQIIAIIAIPILAAGIGAAIGAIMAFRYQHTLELGRDKRMVIQTLMMYRNVGAQELAWINSLNAIDLVFNKDKQVIRFYHTLLAQLSPALFRNGQWIETYFQLIFEMAECTEYRGLTLDDIRNFYAPEALNTHYPNRNVGSEPSPPASTDLPPATP